MEAITIIVSYEAVIILAISLIASPLLLILLIYFLLKQNVLKNKNSMGEEFCSMAVSAFDKIFKDISEPKLCNNENEEIRKNLALLRTKRKTELEICSESE